MLTDSRANYFGSPNQPFENSSLETAQKTKIEIILSAFDSVLSLHPTPEHSAETELKFKSESFVSSFDRIVSLNPPLKNSPPISEPENQNDSFLSSFGRIMSIDSNDQRHLIPNRKSASKNLLEQKNKRFSDEISNTNFRKQKKNKSEKVVDSRVTTQLKLWKDDVVYFDLDKKLTNKNKGKALKSKNQKKKVNKSIVKGKSYSERVSHKIFTKKNKRNVWK
mmetsp:Transcript_16229/g.24057  ORF Transcript_16229/g.24057 Transcript_16229/m.24057 type:complete len:222 (+) Transcript_16229:24-689(+)